MQSRTEYFSQDYIGARARFIEASKTHPFTTATSSFIYGKASKLAGTRLTTDVTILGDCRTAKRKVYIASGVHGVEGFPGSAIQLAFMDELAKKRLPKNTAFIFIHGVNPYGMHALTRVNEDNIDLNRNFTNFESKKLNEAYAGIHSILIDWNKNSFEKFNKSYQGKRNRFIKKHGYKAWQDAVVPGQYHFPDGIIYGGTEASQSRNIFEQIIKNTLLAGDHVVFVDLHSGADAHYGPAGTTILLPNASMDFNDFKRAVAWWGGGMEKYSEDYSGGVPLDGEIACAFNRSVYDLKSFTSVTVECCVATPIKQTIDTLVADNWLARQGLQSSEEAKRIKKLMFQSYAPFDPIWERDVVKNGLSILRVPLQYKIS